MKVTLVTSQLTYMPNNYEDLLELILKWQDGNIHSVIELENRSMDYFVKGIGLFAGGARNLGSSLVKNTYKSYFNRKKYLSQKYGVHYQKTKSMNDQKIIDFIKSNDIDIVFNLRTRCIYKKEILNAPKLGCLNIHHGILPKYRGTLCDLYALKENRVAGFSIHRMTENLDAGEIIKVCEVQKGQKNYYEYLKKTVLHEAVAISEVLDQIKLKNKIPSGKPNITSEVVYTKTPQLSQLREFTTQGMIL